MTLPQQKEGGILSTLYAQKWRLLHQSWRKNNLILILQLKVSDLNEISFPEAYLILLFIVIHLLLIFFLLPWFQSLSSDSQKIVLLPRIPKAPCTHPYQEDPPDEDHLLPDQNQPSTCHECSQCFKEHKTQNNKIR